MKIDIKLSSMSVPVVILYDIPFIECHLDDVILHISYFVYVVFH